MITFDRDQQGWGSRRTYDDGTLQPFLLDKIVLHWGGGTNPGHGEADEARILRQWQNDHMDNPRKKWVDIGYNFAVGNSGLVYRLRGLNRAASVTGDLDRDGIPENEEALAFVWIGGSAGTPSVAAYASMARIVNEVFAMHGEVPVTVHSDHSDTTCPGDDWRTWRDVAGWDQIAAQYPDPEDWARDVWDWALSAGIMTSASDPFAVVTKQEMAAFLWRTVRHVNRGGST